MAHLAVVAVQGASAGAVTPEGVVVTSVVVAVAKVVAKAVARLVVAAEMVAGLATATATAAMVAATAVAACSVAAAREMGVHLERGHLGVAMAALAMVRVAMAGHLVVAMAPVVAE